MRYRYNIGLLNVTAIVDEKAHKHSYISTTTGRPRARSPAVHSFHRSVCVLRGVPPNRPTSHLVCIWVVECRGSVEETTPWIGVVFPAWGCCVCRCRFRRRWYNHLSLLAPQLPRPRCCCCCCCCHHLSSSVWCNASVTVWAFSCDFYSWAIISYAVINCLRLIAILRFRLPRFPPPLPGAAFVFHPRVFLQNGDKQVPTHSGEVYRELSCYRLSFFILKL